MTGSDTSRARDPRGRLTRIAPGLLMLARYPEAAAKHAARWLGSKAEFLKA